MGAPDRRSRIISTDKDGVFHTRVTSVPPGLREKIHTHFAAVIAEWVGQPVVYSAGFGETMEQGTVCLSA
eukprot:SAG22_NODE_2810_length_2190_cov_1.417025_3_plen_69_part_01